MLKKFLVAEQKRLKKAKVNVVVDEVEVVIITELPMVMNSLKNNSKKLKTHQLILEVETEIMPSQEEENSQNETKMTNGIVEVVVAVAEVTEEAEVVDVEVVAIVVIVTMKLETTVIIIKANPQ